MKIIYLHQYFNTPDMSGGTRSYEMARRLVAAGHEVHMVTTWREATEKKGWFLTEEAGIQVHWLPVPYSNKMGFGERILAFFRFALQSARKATSLPGDVVFATSTPLTIAFPGIYASRCKKIPMVFEVRDLWPEIPIAIGALRSPSLRLAAKMLEKLAYKYSQHIVALSPGMRDGVVHAGYPANRVSVIPNSSDLDLFDPSLSDRSTFFEQYPELKGSPLVLYTGTMGKINGVGYMVNIAKSSLRLNQKINFVVIGHGAEEEIIRKQAANLGVLGNNFFIYSAVAKKMMPNILAAADIALSLFIDLKPMWANSANKFFDALASATPIAINYSGWQAELLEETGAGLVLPANSPEEAARLLVARLADQVWLKAAGAKARQLAEVRFSRDILASQLEQVLVGAVSLPIATRTAEK